MKRSSLAPMGQLDADGTSHAVEVIERNAAAQRQIIEDLLDVSRIVTGKLRISTSELKTVDQECRRSFWCVYQRWPVVCSEIVSHKGAKEDAKARRKQYSSLRLCVFLCAFV